MRSAEPAILDAPSPVYDLATQPATAPAIKSALALVAAMVLTAGTALLVGREPMPSIPGLLLIMTAAIGFMNLVTAYVLLGYFRTTKQIPVLFLGAAYLLCGFTAIASLLTFPSTFIEGRIGIEDQSVVYLWFLWHAGFPVLLLLSTLFRYRKDPPGLSRARTGELLTGVIVGCALLATIVPFILIMFGDVLPNIFGEHWLLTALVALLLLAALNVAAVARLFWKPKWRTTTHLWLVVALLALFIDAALTLVSARYSYAWYTARMFGVIASTVLLGGYIRAMISIHAALVAANMELRSINELERRRAEERLIYLAYHDELTGLPNRSRWQELLKASIGATGDRKGAQPFAVMFVDLDNFKDVNDAIGHVGGDDVLFDAACRLRAVLRPDDVVGRIGGDEFAVLLPDIDDLARAEEVAERLLGALRRPFSFHERSFELSASVGIAQYPEHGVTAEALLQQSDIALYCAKREGGNCYRRFTPSMGQEHDHRRDLKGALSRAIESGEFVLHYQPLLDLRSGRIGAAEALIRWYDPEKGVISPAAFIGLAEEVGLMPCIGRWTLESAIEQALRWDQSGQRIKISVNVSAKQLHDPSFVDHLSSTLGRFDVSPSQLQIEVTESVAMSDVAAASAILWRVRRLGVEIVLDDFGTHYSSLRYLQQHPIDTIKIDRGFVSGLPWKEDDAAIVRGVISLAHDLRRTIVAEGVETTDQLEFLRQASCDVVQGYLIARPMPAARFAEWRAAHPIAWEFATPEAPALRVVSSA